MLHRTPRVIRLGITLAALLSGLRLLLAFALPLLLQPWQVVAVIFAAISDGLDGITARLIGKPTWWGAWLDAVADKLFALSALTTLMLQSQLALWQVILLLARDLAVSGLFLFGIVTRRWPQFRQINPGQLGKATTAALFLLFLALLAMPDATTLHGLLFLLGAALSVAAAFDYLQRLRHLPPFPKTSRSPLASESSAAEQPGQ